MHHLIGIEVRLENLPLLAHGAVHDGIQAIIRGDKAFFFEDDVQLACVIVFVVEDFLHIAAAAFALGCKDDCPPDGFLVTNNRV